MLAPGTDSGRVPRAGQVSNRPGSITVRPTRCCAAGGQRDRFETPASPTGTVHSARADDFSGGDDLRGDDGLLTTDPR
jgi:hypothetical protein